LKDVKGAYVHTAKNQRRTRKIKSIKPNFKQQSYLP